MLAMLAVALACLWHQSSEGDTEKRLMPVHKAQPLHSIAPLPQMFSFPPTPRPVICFLNQPGRLLHRFFFFLKERR